MNQKNLARPRVLASITLLLAALVLAACSSAESSSEGAGRHGWASPLASTFAAHGGLEAWRAQGTFRYTMKGFPLSGPMSQPNVSTVDLQTRRNRIDGQGFSVGWDGEQAWGSPALDSAGLPPRFVSLGSFYFIGMPFVFGDPGAAVERLDDERWEGRRHEAYRITYPTGVGKTPDDDYVVFVDPGSRRLVLIHHNVTEKGAEVERVTWIFESWQRVAGLLVPERMTFHPGWNPGARPAEGGASFTIEDVAFAVPSPDPSLYAAPRSAAIAP